MEECLPIQLLHKVHYNIITLLLTYSLAANAPTSLAVSIIDSTSIRLSWTALVGGANGYIVVYNNVATDVSSTETVLSGLSTATVYNITVYGYKDIPSVASDTSTVSILLDAYGELMYTENDSTYILVAVQVSCDVSVTTVTSTSIMFYTV